MCGMSTGPSFWSEKWFGISRTFRLVLVSHSISVRSSYSLCVCIHSLHIWQQGCDGTHFKAAADQYMYYPNTVCVLHVVTRCSHHFDSRCVTVEVQVYRSLLNLCVRVVIRCSISPWQAPTRVDGNKKGILTRARQPKAAALVLRQHYLAVGQGKEMCYDTHLANYYCKKVYN